MVEWDTSLTSSVEDRILSALNHERPDRPPFWEHLNHPGIFDYFRHTGESPHETMARAYRELGIDVCRGYNLPFARSRAGEVAGASNSDIEDLEQELQGDDWTDTQWTSFHEELLRGYYAVRQSLAPHTMYVPTMGTGLTDLYVSVGYERFCLLLKSRPALIGELLRHRARDNLRWLRKAAQERLCPMFLIAEDIGGKNGLLFSPDWLRRHFIPALKMLTGSLKRAGIKSIFHSDGNVTEILEDLIEAGIDGLHPIEPMAGMDIARIKKRYGEDLVLVGNVDCGRLLPLGCSRDIRRAVAECKRVAGQDGGYFVGSSGELHAGIPVQNVFTFCQTCRRKMVFDSSGQL